MSAAGVAYEVRYLYYQHNSGAADNGHRWGRREFATAEEAIWLVGRIDASAASKLPEEEDRELQDDLIPYMGHFEPGRAEAYKVERTLLTAT